MLSPPLAKLLLPLPHKSTIHASPTPISPTKDTVAFCALTETDAILEDDVIPRIKQFLTSKGSPFELVDTLSNTFYNLPALCDTLANLLVRLDNMAIGNTVHSVASETQFFLDSSEIFLETHDEASLKKVKPCPTFVSKYVSLLQADIQGLVAKKRDISSLNKQIQHTDVSPVSVFFTTPFCTIIPFCRSHLIM
jgi:TH1 protein